MPDRDWQRSRQIARLFQFGGMTWNAMINSPCVGKIDNRLINNPQLGERG